MLTKVCPILLSSPILNPEIVLSLRQPTGEKVQSAQLLTRFLAFCSCAPRTACEVGHLRIVDVHSVVAVVVYLVAIDVYSGAFRSVSRRTRGTRRDVPEKFRDTEARGVSV